MDDDPEDLGRHLPIHNLVPLNVRSGAVSAAVIPANIPTDCRISAMDGLRWLACHRRRDSPDLQKERLTGTLVRLVRCTLEGGLYSRLSVLSFKNAF